MQEKIVKIIFASLLVLSFFSNIAFALELSSKEQEALQNLGTIRIGVIEDMPPIEYYGAGYKHQGIVADFLNQIIAKLKLKVEYRTGNQEELFELLLKKEIDVISYTIKDEINKEYMLFTKPYFEIENSLFIKKNATTINHLSDLSQSLVGITYRSVLKEPLQNKFPKMQFRYTFSSNEATQLILAGKIDGYIGSSLVGDYILNNHSFQTQFKKTDISWLRVPLHFGITKNKPFLQILFQKALDDIDQTTRANIVKKWAKNPEKYQKIPISLTKEENAWIRQNPTISVGVSTEWRPLSYFENNKIQGVTSSFLEIISKKTGIEFTPIRYELFSNMLSAMKEGEIDIVDAVVASKTRAQYMNFSDSYLSLDNIIAINKNQKSFNSINDLKGKRVGILAGYIVNSYLAKDVPNIKLTPFDDIKAGLQSLSNGELDAFVVDLPMFDYYTAKYQLTNLIVCANTPYSFPIHFGVKKSEKHLVSIFNKALNSIKENERNQIYRKWISVEFSQKIDYTLVWQIIGIFLAFLLGTLLWNRRLRQEIDKRKKIEQELVKAKETAEDATKAKSIFLANMSHEIRTPMNSVIGFADLLDELIVDPTQKSYLNSIKVGGKALLGIINDILDLSKVEAGQLTIVKESVNVHNLFLEMEQFFHDKVTQKNIAFNISIDPAMPHHLILDGVRLRQILLNLLGNAVKFTEKGSVSLNVEQEFKDGDNSTLDLIFIIKDTGIGIPKSAQDNIFQAFVQKKKQSVKKYGGTGLGLSICKSLVDIMGGKIALESEVGKGTTFKVRLQDIEVSSIVADDEEEDIGDIVFKPATILAVDDVEENRDLIKAIFSNSDIIIQEARDGQEAIDIATQAKPHLILMDLQMPKIDGYKATQTIREHYNKEELPIIALTASVMGESLEKVEMCGFNGYLRKPTYKKAIIQELMHYLPYTQKEEKVQNSKKESEIFFETKEIKEKIVQTIEEEITPFWKEIKDKGDIQLVEDFNKKLQSLSNYQQIKTLEKYTQDLLVCTQSFDLEQMYKLLNSYSTLAQELKEGEIKNV